MGPDHWRVWRDLRLEGLQDTPIGFGRRYEEEVLFTDEQWRSGGTRPGVRVLAHDRDEPVGICGAFRDEAGTPVVFGVFVRPSARGNGVLGAMLEVLEAWAAPDRLELDVHEDNARARRAYAKLGFVETGGRTAGGGIDGRDLIRMRLPRPS